MLSNDIRCLQRHCHVNRSAVDRRIGVHDKMRNISFTHYRFAADIICHAVWLYTRFTLSYRDVEDFLVEPRRNGFEFDAKARA